MLYYILLEVCTSLLVSFIPRIKLSITNINIILYENINIIKGQQVEEIDGISTATAISNRDSIDILEDGRSGRGDKDLINSQNNNKMIRDDDNGNKNVSAAIAVSKKMIAKSVIAEYPTDRDFIESSSLADSRHSANKTIVNNSNAIGTEIKSLTLPAFDAKLSSPSPSPLSSSVYTDIDASQPKIYSTTPLKTSKTMSENKTSPPLNGAKNVSESKYSANSTSPQGAKGISESKISNSSFSAQIPTQTQTLQSIPKPKTTIANNNKNQSSIVPI